MRSGESSRDDSQDKWEGNEEGLPRSHRLLQTKALRRLPRPVTRWKQLKWDRCTFFREARPDTGSRQPIRSPASGHKRPWTSCSTCFKPNLSGCKPVATYPRGALACSAVPSGTGGMECAGPGRTRKPLMPRKRSWAVLRLLRVSGLPSGFPLTRAFPLRFVGRVWGSDLNNFSDGKGVISSFVANEAWSPARWRRPGPTWGSRIWGSRQLPRAPVSVQGAGRRSRVRHWHSNKLFSDGDLFLKAWVFSGG